MHNSTCPHQNRNFKAGKRPLGENARLPLRARKNIVIVLKMLSFLFILAVERGDKMYAKESRSKRSWPLTSRNERIRNNVSWLEAVHIAYTGCPVTGDRTKFHFCKIYNKYTKLSHRIIYRTIYITLPRKSYIISLILNIDKKLGS